MDRGGEHVAAKINEDHRRRKQCVCFTIIGIVIGVALALGVIYGGDAIVLCDRIDEAKLTAIKERVNASAYVLADIDLR